MTDSIVDKAVNVAEMSEDILDGIITQLETATNALNDIQQAGDVKASSEDALNVNILGRDTTIDSPALSILLQNAFEKLPADKAARIAAEQNKIGEKIQRYTA